jgi:CSLREA domain-containing protein
MNFRRRVTLTLLTSLLALALPATAAAEIQINSTADEPDLVPGGACDTLAGDCTLRAAIEVANAAGTAQDVFFGEPFNGELTDSVALASPLPPIKAPISLSACRLGLINKPCAAVSGPAGEVGISVEADGVTISGLSITGALIGIDVIGESHDFTAEGNRIGVKLDGSAGPNKTGIFIGPGSDGATIGGSNPGERNVIAGNDEEGLDIEGASDGVIRGNYFGIAPDGTTQMGNATNIQITDSTEGDGFAAENNEVGASIKGGPSISEACDGGCNVIAAAEKGIRLNGSLASEAPASGPTLIHGNYIGLDAAGDGASVNNAQGVIADEADWVTVGGLAASEKNYFAGNSIAIVGGGESLSVLGNAIGIAPDGSDLPAPEDVGIFAGSSSVSEAPSIEGNEIRMTKGTGIAAWFATGRIVGNHLEGGSTGIETIAEPGGGLIAANQIESPSDSGIILGSPGDEVRANTITDSAGVGIRVSNPFGVVMSGLIGGDTADKENVITGSSGAAIEIVEEALAPGSATEIARNRGSSNGGLFIDLLDGANEGISPPPISSARQSSASGTALPGATIRVFRKAAPEPGELQSFLAETVADGGGNWKVTYGSIPAGTLVAATQTNENGATSELASASVAADTSDDHEPQRIRDPMCAFTRGKCRWPETMIKAGPRGKIHVRTVKFRFSSDMPGATFQCKLDRKPFRPCASPKKYKKLKPGKHVFKVRAIDKAGNVDPTPAKRKFIVLK